MLHLLTFQISLDVSLVLLALEVQLIYHIDRLADANGVGLLQNKKLLSLQPVHHSWHQVTASPGKAGQMSTA